jgi:hypothetical protein
MVDSFWMSIQNSFLTLTFKNVTAVQTERGEQPIVLFYNILYDKLLQYHRKL